VAGRPLLAHVFETAVEAGADELVVIVGYEAATVRMGERVNVNTSDDVEQASELVCGESETSS
jgi:CTP:molybdopterin cytidylyltransferase MocA